MAKFLKETNGLPRGTDIAVADLPSAIPNANLATMANNTVKGNISGGSAVPSDVSAVTTATASSFVVRDANANTAINNTISGLTVTATTATTTTLTVSSTYAQQFTGFATQTVVLPNAAMLSLGQAFMIMNRSAGVVTVNANGGSLIQTMAPGSQTIVTVTNIGSSAGTWDSAYSVTSSSSSPLTTKGDIYTYDTGNQRLPVGTNGQVLTVDSTQTTGIKWATPSSGGTVYPWVGNVISLSAATTSKAITFTNAQLDISYIIFAMLENTVDTNPQFQQVEITAKTTSGCTAIWDTPLDSANYKLSLILPPKMYVMGETSIGSAVTSVTSTFSMPQPASNYGVVAQIQNLTDTNPQFSPLVVTAQTTSGDTLKWNGPTPTANYAAAYMVYATIQVAVSSAATSAVITLPVGFGTTNYAEMVTWQNLTDTNPQFQPLTVIAKTTNTLTIGWNVPTATANYVLTCYAQSVTP